MWHLACEIDIHQVGRLDRRDAEKCKSWLDSTFGPGNWILEYGVRYDRERLLVKESAWPKSREVLVFEVGRYRYALHPPMRPFQLLRLDDLSAVTSYHRGTNDSTNRSKTLLLL